MGVEWAVEGGGGRGSSEGFSLVKEGYGYGEGWGYGEEGLRSLLLLQEVEEGGVFLRPWKEIKMNLYSQVSKVRKAKRRWCYRGKRR